MGTFTKVKSNWMNFCGKLDLEGISCGTTENLMEWESKRSFSGDAHFRLYFPTAGKFNLLYSSEVYPIVPGFRYLIPPVVPFRFEGVEPTDHAWIHFYSHFLEKLPYLVRPVSIPVDAAEDFARFRDFFILAGRSSSIFDAEEIRHVLARFLLPFIEPVINRQPDVLQSGVDFPKVLEYIDKHLSGSIKVQELERIAGLRRAEFSARFRRIYGIPPKQYITLRRVSRAKYLLSRTSLSIKGIAWETGFENATFFFHVFKAYTDMTPLQFRERNQTEPTRVD